MKRFLQPSMPRGVLLVPVVAASLFAASAEPCVAVSAGPSVAMRTRGAESYTFAFRDADIAQVTQEVLGAAGVSYAIDPAVSGKITFRIEQRLTRDQLLAAFSAVLEADGFALVRNGDQVVVTPQAKAKTAAAVRRREDGAFASGYEVVAVPLAYAEPSEVAKALEAISGSGSVIFTSDKLGLMVLGGTGAQLKSATETIKIFDQSAFQDTRIRWFELNQAQAGTVAAELTQIVQGAGLVGVTVAPLKRLNGVIVFARSGDAMGDIAKWVARLDAPGKEAASTLWVYRPRASSAEDLARTLTGVLGSQNTSQNNAGPPTNDTNGARPPPAASAPSQPAASPFGQSFGTSEDQVRIGADKQSNTLIIFASAARWVQIQRILAEVDRTPRQILIEASIMEVTLNKDFQFGVDWSVLSNDLRASSVNNSTGTVGPNFPGLSVTFLNNNIEAAVHALGSRTAVDVVSAPKIIALDNRTARLDVGDQVPVVTQSAQSTLGSSAPLINTVDYRNTGVILTVTPRVIGEDRLILEVNQEVSSVGKTITSGIDSPTIQQRRFESTLVLQDGAVVALGGLISTNRTVSNSGVPILKDVPLLGALFRSQIHDEGRSELIVLLTAKIIKDRVSSDAVMNDLLADMHELESHGLLPVKHQ